MKKKFKLTAAIAALTAVAVYFGKAATAQTDGLSDLRLANAEALAQGEITLVGCKPYDRATCYVFDGNGQLVDKQKNKYPGELL